MKIYYKVYEKRDEKGLTLRELSDISGISKSEINRIENQKSHPTLYTLLKIAKSLDCDVTELFSL